MRAVYVGCVSFCLLAPVAAEASPWTLPAGSLVLSGTYTYQTATQEYFERDGARNYPLNGSYTGTNWALALRAGLTDRFEVEASIPLRLVNYSSDPVVLLARPPGSTESEMAFYQRNVVNLSRAAAGIGDINLAGRYQLVRQPFVLATELRLKIPTGYASPVGTFGAQPQSAAEFAAAIERYGRPSNVQDDVTLGDGQTDIQASMLWGYALPSRTFFRVDLGFNLRLGGAGDQVVGAVRMGQQIADVLLFYAHVQGAFSVDNGRFIGVSVAAIDPDLPAAQYGGTRNLLLRELRLERDVVEVGGGVILRFTREVELNTGVSRVLWGRNTAAITQVSVGIAVRTRVMDTH